LTKFGTVMQLGPRHRQPIKFREFKYSRWRRRPLEKSQYLHDGWSRWTNFNNIWYGDVPRSSRPSLQM